jgi:superfamily II DNA or RNA helicase
VKAGQLGGGRAKLRGTVDVITLQTLARHGDIAGLTSGYGLGPPLLAVATGPYAGEGFDCPALDTLFLAAPVAQKGRLVQYAGRILRPCDGKTTAEVHDYHNELTGVLASSLAKRAPGYTSLGFPDPRKHPYTPSSGTARQAQSEEQPG